MNIRPNRKSGPELHKNAAVPDGKRVYAIGDIHGRLDMLNDLLERIEEDCGDLGNAQLIFLGDYVDRGQDSRGVIDRLIELKRIHKDTVFLKGNHEAIMIDFLMEPEDLPQWLDWGGEETLESYGIDPVGISKSDLADAIHAAMPQTHFDFLNSLSLTHIEGDYLFVHAGVRPGAALEDQSETDLLWIRKRFHNAAPAERPDYVVVYGHTPVNKPEDAGWRIGVDTGACYGGMLTAVALEGTKRRFLSVKD
ncbi:metallophosphoesterase family protein [Hyphococcus sp.]|uniref:metallophosphoesterase family protein n=1 Tax=Hyphococcus sp. TaxID=2038636 RepID=UPI00208AD160|nr:MAG: metallophosphoesterase [Marinicaulis sp.]